jgi:tetratricopeptide (TPR) repeat protein
MATPATPVPSPTASSPRVAAAKTPAGPVTRDEVLGVLERARSRSLFEVLGVSHTASDAEVKEAAAGMTKRFHPDVPLDPDAADLKRQVEATEAYDVLRDRERRERHERSLGVSPGSRAAARGKEEPVPSETPATPPAPSRTLDLESDALLAESILMEARALLRQQRHWDAIQKLEGAVGLAHGTRINQNVRVVLAQTFGKNPKWQKRAEEMLLAVIQENPKLVDAYMELGTLYKRLGLKARAAAQFRQVLQLRPLDAQATAELAALA